MWARLANLWENAQTGLWFVPALLVLGAVLLSSLLLYIDHTLAPNLEEQVPWLFGGTAGAARSLLSTIAGSLITVISVAFSITIVALQQAATQYSPRVLRNFTRDRGNQVVLGSYLATFTYSLLVMRQVREPTSQQAGFVPALSVTTAIILALVSVGMLIYFIDHVSRSLQVSSILASIHEALNAEVENLFPSKFGRGSVEPPSMKALLQQLEGVYEGPGTAVLSEGSGYLRRIDEGQLTGAARPDVRLIRVCPQIGNYLQRGTVLARIWTDTPLSGERRKEIADAFVLDWDRSMYQDPLFGVKMMVDIAVKALSPGINDPTTAEQSLSKLGDVVGALLKREFPSPLRHTEQRSYFLFNRPDFPQFVDASFSQIRRNASKNVHVTLHLLDVLGELAQQAPNAARGSPLRTQVEEVLAALDAGGFTHRDQQAIRDRAGEVLDILRGREQIRGEAA